jgi:dihydrofolate synthase/folylpolyglutamate synthase
LEKSGYRTGLFVSPHVSCFRERIQINGQLISEEEVAETLSQIFNMSAQLRIPATFFEITTMLALQHFAKQKVDCVVLETGLGGRLDSTNIVNPTMSVITSIGLDHTRILGNTIAKIAKEKAGIIKPDTPVVIGPHAAPVEIMTEYANKMNAPLSQVPYDSSFSEDFNEENTAIAQTVCAKLNERVLEGKTKLYVDLEVKKIQNALSSRPPCRFQVLHLVRPNSKERKVTIVLDVAHNEPAICRLVNLLKKRFPTQTYRFVCGFSADKDLPKVIQLVQSATPNKDYIHLVKAKHPRGASLEEINTGLDVPFETIASVSDGVEDALATARESQEEEEEQIVVVCGSVFLMSEARQALGFREPVDSAGLNDVAGSYLSTPETRINQKQKR